MTDKTEIFKKRRKWVNKEISKRTSGKKLSNSQRATIWQDVWSEAKKEFPD
jgi:hypothetical protein